MGNLLDRLSYDWQAKTRLPEYLADVTDPLYGLTDRYLDLGPVNVNKQIKKTIKDGVKKGIRKAKEAITDIFEPQPATTYKFGGTVNRFKYK